MEQVNTKSNMTVTGRGQLALSGVKKVRSAEPSQVVAVLDNCQIIIQGANLSVQNVNIPSGILELTGAVNSIRYTGAGSVARKFSFKNMFR
jgi:hypothetical protein